MNALLTEPITRTPPPRVKQETGPGHFRFTREQYYRLGELNFFERTRVERLHGEIVVMSPMNWPHSVSVGLVMDALIPIFAGIGWPNVQSPLETDDSDPEPDFAIYRGRRRDYKNHPAGADTLLIVEVAVTSLVGDSSHKADLYAAAGIADYWVVDVENRRLLVFREPSPAGYLSKQSLGHTENISPLAVPSASIRVADLLP